MTNDENLADKIYRVDYQNLLNTGAVGVVSNWSHRALEKNAKKHFSTTLELGAGHGQHFQFVKHTFEKYLETDIRINNLPKRPKDNNVEQLEIDAENLKYFEDASIDRIVVSCVLIHLNNPEKALLEWRRVLAPGGQISIYLAPEPGMLLRMARYFTTARKLRSLGVNHPSFHYREHRYSYLYLKALIEDVFSGYEKKWRAYPFIHASWNFSLWKTVDIFNP